MNYTISHRITSVLLALIVLISTLSLTVEKHFCGDTLVDVAIFSQSNKCGMKMASMDSGKAIKSKSCCKDEVNIIEGQDDLLVKSMDDFEGLQKHFIVAFTHTYFQLFEDVTEPEVSYQDYKPPKIIQDIQVLHDTFLI